MFRRQFGASLTISSPWLFDTSSAEIFGWGQSRQVVVESIALPAKKMGNRLKGFACQSKTRTPKGFLASAIQKELG